MRRGYGNALVAFEVRVLQRLREGPAHGYLIASDLGASTSTTTRALQRLEKRGLLESSWEPPGRGPVRKVYELAPCRCGHPHEAHAWDGPYWPRYVCGSCGEVCAR